MKESSWLCWDRLAFQVYSKEVSHPAPKEIQNHRKIYSGGKEWQPRGPGQGGRVGSNLLRFNKAKCKALHPQGGSWQHRSHHSPQDKQLPMYHLPMDTPSLPKLSYFLFCLTPLSDFIKSYWTKNYPCGSDKPSSISSFLMTIVKPHISPCHSMG